MAILIPALIATLVVGGMVVAGARGLRGALTGLALSALLPVALVGASLILTPQPVSSAGRSYALGQHLVAGMDLMLIGFVAVGVGAALGAELRWRRRARLASHGAS